MMVTIVDGSLDPNHREWARVWDPMVRRTYRHPSDVRTPAAAFAVLVNLHIGRDRAEPFGNWLDRMTDAWPGAPLDGAQKVWFDRLGLHHLWDETDAPDQSVRQIIDRAYEEDVEAWDI